MTEVGVLDLHVPDEPVARSQRWRSALHDGRDVDEVLGGDDGVTSWLWSRWRAPLAAAGVDEAALGGITGGYRRELRLWLEGDRTWSQCCSGLIGRITRRAAGSGPAEV